MKALIIALLFASCSTYKPAVYKMEIVGIYRVDGGQEGQKYKVVLKYGKSRYATFYNNVDSLQVGKVITVQPFWRVK